MSVNQTDFLVGTTVLEGTGIKIVPVLLLPLGELAAEEILFRLDSGADLSFINKNTLFKLGYSMEWINKNIKTAPAVHISTADGTLHSGTYVEIPLMTFMGKDFHKFRLYVISDYGLDYTNLLGLDVSTQFNYFTNNEKGILEFYRINESKFSEATQSSKYIVGETEHKNKFTEQ